jgi:hypothetical protein
MDGDNPEGTEHSEAGWLVLGQGGGKFLGWIICLRWMGGYSEKSASSG